MWKRDSVPRGYFTKIERRTPGMRLLDGTEVVDLLLENYDEMPPKWRDRIPLKPVLAVAVCID